MTTSAPSSTPEAPADTTGHSPNRSMIIKVAIILASVLAIWFIPPPDGVDPRGMHMAAIFVGTILGLVLQPLPTAAVSLIGLAVAMITGTMDVGEDEALTGFASSAVWLIVAAFFIADGFLITGLGRRIALWFVTKLGKSSLGLAYGMAATDLLMAPATPSNTARAGGVVFPIVQSLAVVQGSTPETDESRRRLGAFLSMSTVQVNTITSAMFLTAMAGNPLAQQFAGEAGVEITWTNWALAAIVPGLVSLVVVPWVLSKVYPPTLKKTPDAPGQAREELKQLGKLTRPEAIMAATFVLLLLMWSVGGSLGINATATAFVGIGILLVTGVLNWKIMAANGGAWSTLIFFGVLVGMAGHLNTLGVITWIGDSVSGAVGGLPWVFAFAILAVVYFYVHYFFASNTAQIVAMYAVFLAAAIGVGTPPMIAALFLGFIGNLFGGLMHYSSGPAGVIFGSGYVKTPEWFRVGLIISVVTFVIWAVVGMGWMAVLGMW
ncbi:anion permease [Kocuria sp. JC486]|uniref:Anion permease n=1 Tax=Kocuria soli TaxID=2485125 RepID=A0A3N4A832_9MICC|nr:MULTISPECIES: anion permease [Kocuria]NHU86151.1 anion permease [Kocuria sp. JC486]ROZ65715.1 anion permease [Kocuria soli]